jgi:hypothetical protein
VGTKLTWTGLCLMLGLPVFLKAIGLSPSDAVPVAGAIVMTIGVVLQWVGK